MLGVQLSIVSSHQGGSATPALTPGATLVFTLGGQSNMVGRAAFDGGSQHLPGTLQLGRTGGSDGLLIAATTPLHHHDANAGQMGLDIAFAEAFAVAYPGVDLVLIPTGAGGTGFIDNRWNPGDDLYLDAVARTNAVMAQNPDFTFAGFLWHQGEKDVGFAGYQAALDAMIGSFRQDVVVAGPATPFVLGGLVPGWTAENANRQAIQSVIEGTPERLESVAYASAEGLNGAGTDIHFVASDLRGLGPRYFTAWQSLFLGQSVPMAQGTIPDQTDFPASAGAPQTIGTIPDQIDPAGLAPPQAVGTIPPQQDLAA